MPRGTGRRIVAAYPDQASSHKPMAMLIDLALRPEAGCSRSFRKRHHRRRPVELFTS
jgi:hypothetical protein